MGRIDEIGELQLINTFVPQIINRREGVEGGGRERGVVYITAETIRRAFAEENKTQLSRFMI